jgi:hypothetical protein
VRLRRSAVVVTNVRGFRVHARVCLLGNIPFITELERFALRPGCAV